MSDDERQDTWVQWYDHDCEWISKYCDENHMRVSIIPRGVLEAYEARAVEETP